MGSPMSSFEAAFLIVSGVTIALVTVRAVVRWRRIDRDELKTEPGSVFTSPIHGAWTPGRPGQGDRLYTGQAPAHGTNAYGDGRNRF